MSQEPLSLYLHIPFCHRMCNYCDFNTYAGLEGLIPAYVDALCQEIGLWGQEPPWPAHTIYLGGGTPSLLTPEQMERILQSCRDVFQVAADAEVSMEANPSSLTLDLLRGFRDAGVNRLSLGVQSFDDRELAALTRDHSAAEAVAAYAMARTAGFASINLDLIYALRDQTLAGWERNLTRALELAPDHLSLYCLTIEEGTPLARAVAKGRVRPPDPDLAADMYALSEEMLEGAGYEHYEISNWAKPGHACRHNLTYWLNRPYLGFGAGAHSSWGGYRFSDVRLPREYVQKVEELSRARPFLEPVERTGVPSTSSGNARGEGAIRARSPIAMLESISHRLAMAESMMLELRLGQGLDLAGFAQRYGVDVHSIHEREITDLMEVGLLQQQDGHLRLTPRGRLLANEVFVRFLGDGVV